MGNLLPEREAGNRGPRRDRTRGGRGLSEAHLSCCLVWSVSPPAAYPPTCGLLTPEPRAAPLPPYTCQLNPTLRP